MRKRNGCNEQSGMLNLSNQSSIPLPPSLPLPPRSLSPPSLPHSCTLSLPLFLCRSPFPSLYLPLSRFSLSPLPPPECLAKPWPCNGAPGVFRGGSGRQRLLRRSLQTPESGDPEHQELILFQRSNRNKPTMRWTTLCHVHLADSSPTSPTWEYSPEDVENHTLHYALGYDAWLFKYK